MQPQGGPNPPSSPGAAALPSEGAHSREERSQTMLSQEDYISDGKRIMVKTKAELILTENP